MESDKLNYSFGMKLSRPNYENVSFSVSLTTSVREGETTDEAFKRLVEWVESKAVEKFKAYRVEGAANGSIDDIP